MKQRNPEATCATCPYRDRWTDDIRSNAFGTCNKTPTVLRKHYSDVCGMHPDFFLPGPKQQTVAEIEAEIKRLDGVIEECNEKLRANGIKT